MSLDYKLIAEADEVAAQYVHDKNNFMMAYLSMFELRRETEFLAAEIALRKFVIDVKLERYAPLVALVQKVGKLRVDRDLVVWPAAPC